jgi:hypothetical protein
LAIVNSIRTGVNAKIAFFFKKPRLPSELYLELLLR